MHGNYMRIMHDTRTRVFVAYEDIQFNKHNVQRIPDLFD